MAETERFEKTGLWQQSLARRDNDPEEKPRERLRSAYFKVRERAAVLAEYVARAIPELTVHDLTHLDALWEIADLIAGPGTEINPCEGFALGCAFLLHDLGMSLAAYQAGGKRISEHPLWADAIANYARNKLGRQPTKTELTAPKGDLRRAALAAVLRATHSETAAELALVSWHHPKSGSSYYLIEDPELRKSFGQTIGEIAHSHGQSVAHLQGIFTSLLGAPASFPPSWSVDGLKLACILRAADACHLDARRAPPFLRALRHPSGTSDLHWSFQEKLHQPTLDHDRLRFTSGESFDANDSEAWWLCFDTLRMADGELDQVDSLLADLGKGRFSAKAVTGVEDPGRLARLIPTRGWTPVDTQIRVGNVAQLVAKLGGEELYGKDPGVPLRELIQNACDAIRARRVLEDRDENWGEIKVALARGGIAGRMEYSLEVSDDGTGMSAEVLTGELLDFGTSLWRSSGAQREFPGLAGKGFESTGKYGIGFFSLFTWGDHVKVVTRRFDQGLADTNVLEFVRGLESRPVLRPAVGGERRKDAGTSVRVWFREKGTPRLFKTQSGDNLSLGQVCAALCPALSVSLSIADGTTCRRIISAGDWRRLPAKELLQRLNSRANELGKPASESTTKFAPNVRELTGRRDAVLGRACIVPGHRFPRSAAKRLVGTVTAGEFRGLGTTGIAGVLIGRPTTASRDRAKPLVDNTGLASWASGQANLFSAAVKDKQVCLEAAALITYLGGDTGELPVARNRKGWLTSAEFADAIQGSGEFLILQDAAFYIESRHSPQLALAREVYVTDTGRPVPLDTFYRPYGPTIDEWPEIPADFPPEWSFHSRTLVGVLIRQAAMAWGVPARDILKVSEQSTDRRRVARTVGRKGGKPHVEAVDIIRRP